MAERVEGLEVNIWAGSGLDEVPEHWRGKVSQGLYLLRKKHQSQAEVEHYDDKYARLIYEHPAVHSWIARIQDSE